ncbi:ABC transporter permease [Allocoleopsis sp.]|uniref:ABC transporter permease n=1 Tax=Allocoleopsis sp. TaxID=3088169 RepID=UPI002FD33A54
MSLPWLDQLGESNPQLFREIKGRLIPRNILIATAVSLVSQLILLMSFSSQLPVPNQSATAIYNRYCTETAQQQYSTPICLSDGFNGFVINWSLWWKDVFIWLSIMGIFALLLVGTYMLIGDLAKEERRGTLNFLRLTPQSSTSILIGKMLGVPILLYWVGFLAVPLHFVAGLSGEIPLPLIFGYYGVLGASCLFFYSLALLFGLVGKWLGGFQPWLGSGVLLLFLYPMTMMLANSSYTTRSPLDWLLLFNPEFVLPYLIGSHSLDASATPNPSYTYGLRELKFFYLPVGSSGWGMAGLMVFNYGLWTYWIGQGFKRCFHNPTATLLGKQQSYWLTACFEAVLLGFALNPEVTSWKNYARGAFDHFQILLVFNLLLFLYLIAALSPQRQAMQDWARYRHKEQSVRRRGVFLDLIWGERSPSLVAVALNLAIASSILLPWMLLWPESEYKIPAFWGLLVSSSLTILYATVAQLMLLMKTPKRAIWAAASLGGLIVVPPIIFGFFSITPTINPGIWLFSAFPWVSLENVTGFSVFLAVIGQSLTFGLLSLQLTRQLKKAGESSTKTLLSGRSPALID